MSAIKLWVRIIAAVLATLGFVSSCGQLLGDIEVDRPSLLVGDDANAPLPKICDLGGTRCDGRVLQLCSDAGTAWATLEVCASAELCQGSDVSTVSSCIPPACAAEQMSCDDNLLRLCNTSRTGWELFATCESAAHCDAGNRQCLPAPCEPGMRRCNVGNLERCNDDSTGWDLLDTCVTNELCEGTLSPAPAAGEALSGGDVPTPPTVGIADGGPTTCAQPICVPREVQCDSTRLNACNEGQTEFTLAEDCATPALCLASITYTGLRGAPRCVRPTCAAGEHRCSDTGVLEICNADRDGYDPIEACIGPPFCNAVAADNGQPGCEQAPCEAGQEQCNDTQIQRCLQDRTGFENVGAPCETRGLCNATGATAFCAAPTCQRGALSGTEFRCQGATLERCNDQLTGFDSISTCATPGLCNAGLGFNGCQPPVCAPGETRCNGNFVQRCNADRTAFENTEQCAAGTCDSALGRCADPCVQGTARCNAQGNLEECRNLLTGREITARCGSLQLCDATSRSCRNPPPGCTADGVRVCQNNVLSVCAAGRSRLDTLDACAPGEVCDVNNPACDVCAQGSEPTCQNGTLVTCAANGQSQIPQACANGCQTVANGPDRCRTCVPGSFRCEGDQLVVCRARGTEEFLERESCDSAAVCQNTVAACTTNGSGEACRCQAGVCDPGDWDCQGNQPVACNTDRTAFVASGAACGPGNCNPRPIGACFACGDRDVRCGSDSIMEGCLSDRSGFADLPGATPRAVRCISDNGGAHAQSCDGASLESEACDSGICLPGIGCAQCDPDTRECTTTSDGKPAFHVCNGVDFGNPVACDSTGGCTVADCTGEGVCSSRSADEGAACTRTGGGPGKCDGAPRNPSCVECFSNADCADAIDCTDDACVGGACQHNPVNSRCDDGLFCSGTSTCNPATGCTTQTAVSCPAPNECTASICDEDNDRCSNSFPTHPCTLPGNVTGVCGGGTCNSLACPGTCPFGCVSGTTTCTCSDTNNCASDPNVCTTRQCNGQDTACDSAIRTTGTCVNNGTPGNCNATGACVVPPPACPSTCSFGCVDGTATCKCSNADDCESDADVCQTRQCNGANTACTTTTRTSGSCSDGGTCDANGTCQPPVVEAPQPCAGFNCQFGCDEDSNTCTCEPGCTTDFNECSTKTCSANGSCNTSPRTTGSCFSNGNQGTCQGDGSCLVQMMMMPPPPPPPVTCPGNCTLGCVAGTATCQCQPNQCGGPAANGCSTNQCRGDNTGCTDVNINENGGCNANGAPGTCGGGQCNVTVVTPPPPPPPPACPGNCTLGCIAGTATCQCQPNQCGGPAANGCSTNQCSGDNTQCIDVNINDGVGCNANGAPGTCGNGQCNVTVVTPPDNGGGNNGGDGDGNGGGAPEGQGTDPTNGSGADPGAGTNVPQIGPICSNGLCEDGEDVNNCAQDCAISGP